MVVMEEGIRTDTGEEIETEGDDAEAAGTGGRKESIRSAGRSLPLTDKSSCGRAEMGNPVCIG